ncbi:MAG: BREX-1 system adenine-specific DNA-methyltransferase PglX [Halioglobus sp.]
MDKSTRNNIQRATQAGRTLLERAFSEQLEGTFDILLNGTTSEQPGSHLSDHQKVTREKLVAVVAHKRSTGLKANEAVDAYLREAAFTTLNRFVALKMLEARDLVQECVSKGEDSSGFKEFTALAPGLVAVEDKGYRLYIETLFDEIGQEVKVLFDRRDVASLLWPDRQTLLELLGILNAPGLASVWAEDETIGWVYQYFNGDEERSKMREESQAPRNSRELAVRNQFFTPRYVVQFLTDNTLGRTWYEMMQGNTQLAHLDYLVRRPNEVFLADGESAPESDIDDSELSQEELLQQTVHVPFRAKKDPRDLHILDPACGSGHFLLYTFDLLVTIYEEAWSDSGTAAFTETATQLRADHKSPEELRRAMPELILRHNLHGVDIDPRAAQIAALALWMRAQRAYNQFEVDRTQRPPITKTNIVVAEPMPGDAELVDEFAASLKPAVLGDLFKEMVEEMKLAGELGSLLKIEESIAKAVKEAAEANQQGNLFAGKVESQNFWDTADEKIIAALGSFAESAAGAGGVRRQLFAGDAAQGVAFIELMRKRFDAVLMNPPFGMPSKRWVSFKNDFQLCRNEIAAAFVERWTGRLRPEGMLGALSNRTMFFLVGYSGWREKMLYGPSAGVSDFVDLGSSVLDDALVEVAAYVVRPQRPARATCVNLTTTKEKGRTLRAATQCGGDQHDLHLVNTVLLGSLPGGPYAYWVPGRVVAAIAAAPKRLEPEHIEARAGLRTLDNFRFLRLQIEVPKSTGDDDWVFHLKGGDSYKYFAPPTLMCRWRANGREIKALAIQRYESETRIIQAQGYYFRLGITYTSRTSSGFGVRLAPAGCNFGNKGPLVVVQPESDADEFAMLAFLNTAVVEVFIGVGVAAAEGAARSYEVGLLQRLPAPQLGRDAWRRLSDIGTSIVHELFDEGGLDPMSPNWHWEVDTNRPASMYAGMLRDRRARCSRRVLKLEAEANEIVLSGYELGGAEADWIAATVATERAARVLTQEVADDATVAFLTLDTLMGKCLGGIESNRTQSDNLPFVATDNPKNHLRHWTPSQTSLGFAVDDSGAAPDLVKAFESVASEYGAESPNEWLTDMASCSGGSGLRSWLAHSYFEQHIRAYSGSRRKAPIYWQLATPSASYSVWCYYHRLTRDTFFRVANDYVTPKVDHEERKLNALRQEAGPEPSSKQRREIDTQETFIAELRAFMMEVKRISSLWNPNLNDGVIINFAPLWRLVPQHKAWQKECKKVWDMLVKGDYDWAHLAMHLWPERVVPKCQADRSLAIAHDLENEFWFEDNKGKWQKLQVSSDRTEELVAERTSTAVKAALKDLLDAPAPGGQTRRKRRASA